MTLKGIRLATIGSRSHATSSAEFADKYPIASDPRFVEVVDRATKSGIELTWRTWVDESGEPWLVAHLQGDLELRIDLDSIDNILSVPFEQWRGIPGYRAVYDRGSTTIHAQVKLFSSGSRNVLQRVGFDRVGERDSENNLRIELDSPSDALAIRLESAALDDVLKNSLALKPSAYSDFSYQMYPIEPGDGPAARRVLEESARSLFFDVECRSGLSFSLARRSALNWRGRGRRVDALPMRYPGFSYDENGLSLFNYASDRDRSGLDRAPLVTYLSYYQVLEYFMPIHSKAAALNKLRQILKDPRFDPDDDRRVSRVLAVAVAGGREDSERGQLRSTIDACVDEVDLMEFLETEELFEALNDKKRVVDVRTINQKDRTLPLNHQIAERVYDIRCRIVHTKDSDSSDRGAPIFPTSEEAQNLEPDIALVRYLAKRAVSTSGKKVASWSGLGS